MEQWDGSKLGKEYIKAAYCHPAYLTYMQSTSCKMPGWLKHSLNQDCWEKYQWPQICRWHHLYGRKWRRTKEPHESERGEWKSWLKANVQKTKIMASGPITPWQIDGDTVTDFIFLGSKITADGDCSHEIKRRLLLGRKVMTNLDSILKSRDITLPTNVRLSQSYGFSSSHVWMGELDYKESWAPKNWCFWTMVLEKALESLLDCKEIQPAHPKGNRSWIFIRRTDGEAETSILWSPDVKNLLIWKDSYVGKDWRWEEKETTEDEIVGWYHQLDGHEFEQALGNGDGQGSLACCNP